MILLPTTLVARYRAVDREEVWAPEHVVHTPSHLDALEADVRANGIVVPLDLAVNERFATLDGNHRIAVALRVGLVDVPVVLRRLPEDARPFWAKDMRPDDWDVLRPALED